MKSTKVIETWIERFNAHDAAGCSALYSDNASLHVAFLAPTEGRAAIHAMFEAYFTAAPLHCLVKHLHTTDDGHVVLEWQDKVGLCGVNIYEVADGLVQRQRNYFDQLSFLRLNGLPLPRE